MLPGQFLLLAPEVNRVNRTINAQIVEKAENMTLSDLSQDTSSGALLQTDLQPDNPREQDVKAFDFLIQLALRKRLIAGATGIGIVVGVVLSFVLPPQFTSITTIMPPKQTPSTTSFLMSQGAGGLGDLGGAGGLLKDPNSIYIGLLKSRMVADNIIRRFGLQEIYHASNMTQARKTLTNKSEIKSEKSTLISVTVEDGDRKRAAAIANAYAEQLQILTKDISAVEATKRRLFFKDQLKNQKEVLAKAEQGFQDVQLQKGLVHLDAQTGNLITGLAVMRAQIAAKEVALKALQSFSTERNPQVALAENEIATLREEATQLEQHDHVTAYTDIGLSDIPKAETSYVHAAKELQYQQVIYDMLLRQYEAAYLDEAKEAAVIQVVEPAIEADQKTSPKRALILIISTILGGILGCALVAMKLWSQNIQADPGNSQKLQELKKALMLSADK